MATAVVDLLEVVEKDHHDRDVARSLDRFRDKLVKRMSEAAAIERSGQRVGFRQGAGLLFGAATLRHFAGQLLVAAPAEDDERDVEHQGVDQRAVGTDAVTGNGADYRRNHGAAGPHEHDNCRSRDAERDDIAFRRAVPSVVV